MVRYNQDNQRDFEERVNAQMISLLTKRTSIEHILLAKSYNRQRSQIYKNILPIGMCKLLVLFFFLKII